MIQYGHGSGGLISIQPDEHPVTTIWRIEGQNGLVEFTVAANEDDRQARRRYHKAIECPNIPTMSDLTTIDWSGANARSLPVEAKRSGIVNIPIRPIVVIAVLFLFVLACTSTETDGISTEQGSTTTTVAEVDTPEPLPSTTGTTVYVEDFVDGAGGWHSRFAPSIGELLPEDEKYVLEWHPDEGGFLRSRSEYPHRWFLDANHACTSPWFSLSGEEPCWGWIVFPHATRALSGIDIRDARVDLTIRTENVLGQPGHLNSVHSDLKLWVQSYNAESQTNTNYVWNEDPISLSGTGWQSRTVVLDPARATCTGGASIKKSIYDCSLTAEQVLTSPTSFLLILGPLDVEAIAADQNYPEGQIDLRDIRVSK